MNFIHEDIIRYSEIHTKSEYLILAELNRETNANVLNPRMLSGHLQGRLLSMISHMIKPQYILEIGTYTGYSAICLCEGLAPHGKLITIDVNEELEELTHSYFERAGLAGRIQQLTGNAADIIPGLEMNFDLVFIDADKTGYSLYYDLIFPKLNHGGYILADNVLWSGNILKPAIEHDDETKAIHAFNEKIQSDSRVENVLLPVRDGIMLVRKK